MRIAIIALSARVYSQLASQAGHHVLAIDAYADVDTQAAANVCWQLPSLHALDKGSLTALMQQLTAFNPEVVLVGAWFEHQVAAYRALYQRFKVAGVAPDAVDRLKSPDHIIALCQAAQIATPAICWQAPIAVGPWLKKPVAGAGGQGVMAAIDANLGASNAMQMASASDYYQTRIQGTAIGMLLLVARHDFLIIGTHRLHTCAGSYQYAGATTFIEEAVTARLHTLCQALLAQDTGLIGLVSLDVILAGDTPYLIDINPRLSASMRLYSDWPLIDMHLDVCLKGGSAKSWAKQRPEMHTQVASHRIAYTCTSLSIASLAYPHWLEDQPSVATLAANQPFFSLFSRGATLPIVMQHLQQQKLQLIQQWGTYVCEHIAFNID